MPASDFFSDDLRQNVLIEREVRHQALELVAFFTQLAQLADLRRPQVGVFALPNVESGLAHSELAAYISDRGAALRLPQRVGDLFVQNLERFIVLFSPGLGGRLVEDFESNSSPVLNRPQKRGSGQWERTMKARRFTQEQIIGVLKEAEAGAKTKDLCRKYGISAPTFYNWKAKYAGMTVSEAGRLKQLEAENTKLKRLLAEAELDKAALKQSGEICFD